MIVILARLAIRPGTSAPFLHTAKQLVEASRQEPGCTGYELLVDGDGRYAFLERYLDEDAAAAHRKTDHFRTLGRALGEFIEGKPELLSLHGIPQGHP